MAAGFYSYHTEATPGKDELIKQEESSVAPDLVGLDAYCRTGPFVEEPAQVPDRNTVSVCVHAGEQR